ncbi:MAG: hypothetical protein ACFHXK_07095 [bacterium]
MSHDGPRYNYDALNNRFRIVEARFDTDWSGGAQEGSRALTYAGEYVATVQQDGTFDVVATENTQFP